MLKFNTIPINYTDQGSGETVVFLHGFIESLEIWDEYSQRFSENYRVICIDLPGHGKSGCAKHAHTIEFMAEVVNGVLNHLKVKKCILVGHSMGGYVTLSFAEKYPKKLAGFCLFHSHPYEDSDQKKKDREMATKIVARNPLILISEMIPNLFADKDISGYPMEIKKLRTISDNMSKDGIIKAIEGMIERKDLQHVLKETKIPVFIILGKKDTVMPYDTIKKQCALSPAISTLILNNSGHMGFIEEKEACYHSLEKFFNS